MVSYLCTLHFYLKGNRTPISAMQKATHTSNEKLLSATLNYTRCLQDLSDCFGFEPNKNHKIAGSIVKYYLENTRYTVLLNYIAYDGLEPHLSALFLCGMFSLNAQKKCWWHKKSAVCTVFYKTHFFFILTV